MSPGLLVWICITWSLSVDLLQNANGDLEKRTFKLKCDVTSWALGCGRASRRDEVKHNPSHDEASALSYALRQLGAVARTRENGKERAKCQQLFIRVAAPVPPLFLLLGGLLCQKDLKQAAITSSFAWAALDIEGKQYSRRLLSNIGEGRCQLVFEKATGVLIRSALHASSGMRGQKVHCSRLSHGPAEN